MMIYITLILFWGITPDIMTFAKGIGSGFPIGGVSANSEIFDTMSKNSLGGTYNGNVISTVASSTTIDIINEENLLINATNMGKKIAEGLKRLPFVDEIRQYGLFIAVDIVPYVDVKEIIERAIQHQLILISSGYNSLRIIPPLTITSEEVEEFLYKLQLQFFAKLKPFSPITKIIFFLKSFWINFARLAFASSNWSGEALE